MAVTDTNNSLGMRYDPLNFPLKFYLQPLNNNLVGNYTLQAIAYPTSVPTK